MKEPPFSADNTVFEGNRIFKIGQNNTYFKHFLQIISKINLRKRYLCLDFTLSKNLNHYIMYSEAIRYNHFLKKTWI